MSRNKLPLPPRPEGVPASWLYCPDCQAERPGSGWKPATAFHPSWKSFCAAHAAKRNYQRRLERLRAAPPAQRAALVQRQQAADRAHKARLRADPDGAARLRQAARKWRAKPATKRHVAEYYAAWAARYPERRKRSQDAWRERKKLRPARYRSRHPDPAK